MQSIKRQYVEFYTKVEATLGRQSIKAPCDSLEFFKQTEKHRYTLYPYLKELMEFGRYKSKKVLEIGVGEGIDHCQFARNKADLCGIDLTPRHIIMTRQRLKAFGLESNLQIADAENLPFANNTFDLVYSCGVLFLVPKSLQAVDEIYRVLKPGGKVIALFYNKNSFQYYVNILIWNGIVRGELQYLALDKLKSWYAGDGFGYPPLKYFNKKGLQKLFHSFRKQNFYITTFGPQQLPIISSFLPRKVIDSLSRYFGYYITIKASK